MPPLTSPTTPLSWNEIRARAYTFIAEWQDETREHAEAKTFWDDFFRVFGVSRRRMATFEEHVKVDGNTRFIDLLWKGTLLIEHKSKGKDLTRAHQQATDYFEGLSDEHLPRYVLVSDFEHFRLYDMDNHGDLTAAFTLAELPDYLRMFGFIAGYEAKDIKPQDPVNIDAAEKMGVLHDALLEAGYRGHALQVYLVRLLFCLFAEDTSIFERNVFFELVSQHTRVDGSDLGALLHQLFEVLNTPEDDRMTTLAEHMAAFPYVNGALFAESLRTAGFDSSTREMLLESTRLDWGRISPAIFGSLFQSVMDSTARRHLGAHYTSEANILKVIEPLFLDDLRVEFAKIKHNKAALGRFHDKLAGLTFLDPACGCGNFLVIAYRELRLLELDVLKALYGDDQAAFDITNLLRVNVGQFFGIEIEEFPAQIAQVALWLVDHQMNLLASETFGQYFVRLPLSTTATIRHANALTTPWQDIIHPDELAYILGNPPFVGAKFLSKTQSQDLRRVLGNIQGAGTLDLVTGWYVLAADYIQNSDIQVAFVSTNSISQGEQVGVLWQALLAKGMVINFAHRTFQWNSEARGKAAVHCVIIGFSKQDLPNKRIFDYETPKAEPSALTAKTINPYLVDAPFVALLNRSKPLCDVPKIGIGNKPIDGGHYLFTPAEKAAFLAEEPQAAPHFRKWIGSQEFLNGIERWCLWLGDVPPHELRQLPKSRERIEAVRQYRLASKSVPTQKIADTPTRFHVENIPTDSYLVVPKTSSERRRFIPVAYVEPNVLAGDAVFVIQRSDLYHFGVLSSTMHMAWVRAVAGRLKSDFRYSAKLVYNNFPWAQDISDKQRQAVEKAAQAVLDARNQYPESTLADLYDPLTTPADLVKAHRNLDQAVDRCYRSQPFTNETQRVAWLFDLYQTLAQPLVPGNAKRKRRK